MTTPPKIIPNLRVPYFYDFWADPFAPLLQCHQKPSGLLEFLEVITVLCLSQLDIDLFFFFTRSETISQFVRWGSVQDDLAVSQILVTKQRNS